MTEGSRDLERISIALAIHSLDLLQGFYLVERS